MKRVLVTGATGFSGQYLCSALRQAGYAVTGTTLRPSPLKSDYPLVSIDLSSRKAAHALVRNLKPQAIFHLAAQSSAQRSWQIQDQTFAANTGITLYLLEALRACRLPARFLFISSTQVYGRAFHAEQELNEATLTWPENPYAGSKRVAELACLDYFNRFGTDAMIARVVNHTGPGQDPHYVFSDWCRQIAEAESQNRRGSLHVGDLALERDFLHVEDVAAAYILLDQKGSPGEIYNIASSKPVALQHYAEFLAQQSRTDIEVISQRSRMRGPEPRKILIDSSKIRSLGWRPSRTTFQALEELLNEWRKKLAHA